MKRILSILLVTILISCACIFSSADQSVGNSYEIGNRTIIFDASSAFSVEEQQYIVEMIVNPENQASTYGLVCTLFGHKNTSETVISITHCAKATSPRCLQENFVVTTCSRCDESTVERVSYSYITCCPVD